MRFKILFAAIIFFLICFAGFLFWVKKSAPPLNQGFIPKPQIPSLTKSPLPIRLEVSELEFSFPGSLPLLVPAVGEPISEQEAIVLAEKAGFTGELIKTVDAEAGNVYIWNNINSYLTIYSQTRQIDYALNSIPRGANKQLSDKEITDIAQKHLQEKYSISSTDADFSFLSFLRISGTEDIESTTKDQATIYQVNFSPIESDHKLLALNPIETPIYIRLLKDGSIVKTHITKLNITKTPENYPLKNYKAIFDSLQKAILISLDSGNLSISALQEQFFKNIAITQIEIVYLVDSPNSRLFQPVYLLKGKASIEGFSEEIEAIFYLPALANQ